MAVMRLYRLPCCAEAVHSGIGCYGTNLKWMRCWIIRPRGCWPAENNRAFGANGAGKSVMATGSESAPARARSPFTAIAIAVVVTLGVLYIVSQFLRNSVGVIAPNLAAEIGLTPIEIGLLSSIYFFCFAATQLPLGVALDRFGPKLCILVSAAFTVLGCALFALASTAGGLVAGRALLGFGTASFLMAPVAL
jgi:MFS family permease